MATALKYRVTGITCLIGCFLYPWRAQAEEPGERAAAEVLFEQGRDAMSDGNYDEACSKFEASMDLDPAPGTLMNLGNCEEQRGNIASAWERYVAAQRELPSTDRRREFAAQKADELEAKVPRLTITLADGAPTSTRVRRDDIDLTASLGISLPLDPGAYQFTAGAEGFEERTFDVQIGIGETLGLEVQPGKQIPKPVKPKPSTDTGTAASPLDRKTLAYVVGGVGVVGIAGAMTAGALAIGQKRTMDEECDEQTRTCSQAGIDARDKGSTYALVSNISGAVGVVALGTGIYLWLTSEQGAGSSEGQRSSATSNPADAAFHVKGVKVEAGTFATYHGLRLSGHF
jgi:hypothetical protein